MKINELETVEIMCMWGDMILSVDHISSSTFSIGEKGNFEIPIKYTEIVNIKDNETKITIPTEASAIIDFPENWNLSLRSAKEQGLINSDNTVTLPKYGKITLNIGEFNIRISRVLPCKKIIQPNKLNFKLLGFLLTSFIFHFIIIGILSTMQESLDEEFGELDKSTQAYLMQLQKNSTRENIIEEGNNNGSASSGRPHEGPSGIAGDPSKQNNKAIFQIKSPIETEENRIGRIKNLIDGNNYGAIGALSSVFGKTNALISWDDESVIGHDPNNFNGNITGDFPGDSYGTGMGLTGIGSGGGCLFGNCGGIGIGQIGNYGHGTCIGDNCLDIGGMTSRIKTERKTKAVKIIEKEVDMIGNLPKDIIKRMIHANFPRFRSCYEQGLKKDPNLRGTVIVRFIIDLTGAVENAKFIGGTLENNNVSSCVVSIFSTISYPEPEGGKVMVTYPIDFGTD